MTHVLLIQLPVPKLNFGLRTGNIPLGAACLKQASDGIQGCRVDIIPENTASHAGDTALIRLITEQAPDILGFTVFAWNLERSLYLAGKIKEKIKTRIVFGGPEITPDNELTRSHVVDFYVFGEGEGIFRALLTSEALWENGQASDSPDVSFLSLGSPYVNGHLSPGAGTPMLIETQRGCPYRCGFCYYNKSRKNRSMADDKIVLDGIAFALDQGVNEIYFLDPSLNSRPGLPALLDKIAGLNPSGKVSLISEIRAESVDEKMAGLFRKAGFTGFEVGLQSTNPKALKKMNRPTDLNAFLSGVKALYKEGITPTVDLIFGLPGDTLDGFGRTLDYVYDHHLSDHLQVFPLLVLPGTAFRENSRELGLRYDPKPPYTLISTPEFSSDDMLRALDMAEEKFDTGFCTFPDLEVSFKSEKGGDLYIDLEGGACLSKLILDAPRDLPEIKSLARQITSPFQVFFFPGIGDKAYQKAVLRLISENNPFVPVEVIFVEPDGVPDTEDLLSAMEIKRPHFLDQDLRYLYPEPGNRAVQFTVISKKRNLFFEGEMKRQIFYRDRSGLPGESDFKALSHLDGLLIDSHLPFDIQRQFQDRIFSMHEDILPVN
ncbi:MAG: radical SAM protein, partial [Desulfobacula sp.]